jgi:hypothetical protein
MYFVITTGVLLLVLVPPVDAQSTNRDSPSWLRFAAVATDECLPDELSTLRKIVPMYIHWHYARHAEWLQDEVIDPILEAMTEEEEGQEGTAKGRGRIFRLLLAILQAADGTYAEQVKSGIPTYVLLENLRAGRASREKDVGRLQNAFTPHLACLSEHRKTIEYLTELNRMPNFPDPIVNPAGKIGRFVGSFMRKHILVDHVAITQSILIAALNAHQIIQPSARQSRTRAASLVLLEKALKKIEPKAANEIRWGGSKKALRDLLDGREELKKRQKMAIQELEDSFTLLHKDYQEIFIVLMPAPNAQKW